MNNKISVLKKIMANFVFFLSFFLLFPYSVLAELNIQVPEAVSQGRGFMISVSDSAPFYGEVKVTWQNKTTVLAVVEDKEIYKAQILLPMPTESKGAQALKIQVGTEPAVTRTIEAKPVTWAKQELTVAPEFVSPPKEALVQIEKDSKKNSAILATNSNFNSLKLPLTRPVKGTISSAFGGKRMFNGSTQSVHRGTDLRGPEGTPILAVADGIVVTAEPQYYSGNVVYVDHGQGVYSSYAHMSAFSVKVGDKVKAGQELGKVGMTGRVTGPHLHISFTLQGTSIDIMPLIDLKLPLVGPATKEEAVVKK